tara:strand:+ start:1912 stop:3066 length:1155 start_codon:yes stop_codon:yes gene_type:complete
MINVIIQKYDRRLLFYFSLLGILGIIMLYSASWYESFSSSNGKTDMLYLKGHLKRLIIGLIFFFLFLNIDYRKLKYFAPYLIVFSIILLIATKALFLINGFQWSKPARWMYVGPFSLQTSDVARFSVLIFMSYYVEKHMGKIQNFKTGLLPAIIILSIVMALIIIQPDFSTAFMIGIIGVAILFVGGTNLYQLSIIGSSALIIGLPILMAREYRRNRIMSWIFGNLEDVGYQAQQSLISLGNGGIFGVGLGNSIEKNRLLPTPHTDFIFAIIGEELGLILGTIPVLTLFLLIFFRGLKVARNCNDQFGVLLAMGISFNFILYAFINVGVVTGILPVTGLPMPLVSYGGSGMVINMILIGILLNISQSKKTLGANYGWSPIVNAK